MSDFIPVSAPLLDGNEEKYVVDCIRTGWISSEGKYIEQLEQQCASHAGVAEGIAVCNGTAALQVALKCLPLAPGDEVIVPSFTIVSCVIAILEAGAVPVLVDCDADTWTMDVVQAKQKITARTKAIMAVHIYGHPVDMDPILDLAKAHNLYVIEDIAEAHGAEYKGRRCGGLGDISITSFYANKLVTTGEGGMILTRHPALAERARSLRNLCFRSERRFYHTEIGHNYRLSNVQAAIGVAQMERLEQTIAHKRRMAGLYQQGLQDLPVQLPVEKPWAKNVYWMYALVLNDEVSMDAATCSRLLLEKNIQTRPFFIGMHKQPVFLQMGLFTGEHYPVCERISQRGLYLPSGQALTDAQIQRVCAAMRSLF